MEFSDQRFSLSWRRHSLEVFQRPAKHEFSKNLQTGIRLIAGLGVEGDAHAGVTVQHRSRVRVDPTQPNLRQVHLIGAELHRQLAVSGFTVSHGALGENVTTEGVDLHALPTGTRLRLGTEAVVELAGLRNPCSQIEEFQVGLLAEVLGRDAFGALVRKAGVMAIVLAGGIVRAGDLIAVELPPSPYRRLERV